MTEFLRLRGAHIAAWVPTFMVIGAFLCAAALLYLWRLRTPGAPQPRSRRAATWLARYFLVSFLIGLGVSLGPMRPLFGSAFRLDSRVGTPVPDFEFTRVSDGTRGRLSDYRGKVVLVNLWATWCPPCRHELPALSRLQDAYRGSGLVVLTLSDEPRETLAGVVDSLAPAAVNGSVASFGWLAIKDFRPFTLVVDRDGLLQDYVFGDQEYPAFERLIGKHLVRGLAPLRP